MWGNILKAVGQAMLEQMAQAAQQQQAQASAQQASQQQRQFVTSLFVGDEAGAIARLRAHVQELDEAQYGVFTQTVQAMLGEAQANLAQAEASGGDTAWGTSFEDRMALAMAQIKTGDYSPSRKVVQEAQQAVYGLQRVAQTAEQFRAEMQQAAAARSAVKPRQAKPGAAQTRPAKPATVPKPAKPDEAAINAMLEKLMATGQMPEGLMQALQNIDDPALMERLTQKLKDAGADQLGDRPLDDIADYYRDGDGLYELLWPVAVSLPMPFDELDRPTQFHVLFAECRRQLAAGGAARNAGRLEEADALFRECTERADQIEVPILKSEAYEGLMTVAEKRGDRDQARRYLQLAERERVRQTKLR